jgi:hypothetical protein
MATLAGDPFRTHLATLLSQHGGDPQTKSISAYDGPTDEEILGGFEAMLGRMRAAEQEVKRLRVAEEELNQIKAQSVPLDHERRGANGVHSSSPCIEYPR